MAALRRKGKQTVAGAGGKNSALALRQARGGQILHVTFEESSWAPGVSKIRLSSPRNYSAAVGMGAAVIFLYFPSDFRVMISLAEFPSEPLHLCNNPISLLVKLGAFQTLCHPFGTLIPL